MTQTLDMVNSMGRRQIATETMLVDLRDQTATATMTLSDTAMRPDNLLRRVETLKAPHPPTTANHTDTSQAT
jgi:hypothetical protein